MPLQVYDKEKILDACLAVFARHGYKNASAVMLAEAAGVSKALIFHHFKSKKELYLCVLDRCIEKARVKLGIDVLSEYRDFFEAIDKYSPIKLDYLKKNPDVYKVAREAFYATPDELKAAIEEKYGELIAGKNVVWERLFKKVPLKEGVDRWQAFELIMIILDHFENIFLSEVKDEKDVDETYSQHFLDKMNNFLNMIRYGIER
ncbi:MAG: HTH-type transcriptional repressor AcnR [Pelotomaculum sp. PtaB.Bin013]|uniref:TetR/AcrR family transcriptional regulator n=1 Tax=Pelotomaculum isophthalicicum JI TaxID=947010 RepID=A0A9X4H080_9FIRM|nr:TetR/AcrR family transcriptional regulator [Pelotomaculum isophthalicicum]MDF9409607.1 TetR/AcrR family transcriptional regulator [Pelotomaculum isophthalicicum JI]OPX81312.1 MAG: HTH-type transcriptional repressor AcnR [Pelotomaculum sp. PtaB.Bin013]